MGGRGSQSSFTVKGPAMPRQQVQQQAQQPVQNQTPDPNNTPVTVDALTNMAQMTDDQLAALYRQSISVDMPNHLNDAPDATQKFAFAAGLNEKPAVLDDADFDQFLKDNSIPRNQIISRSVDSITFKSGGISYQYTAQMITDMMKYSALNYVGGKHGGQAFGAGTYFDMDGGGNTGYGSGATAIAVLNPQTARVIRYDDLMSKVSSFSRSHPKFASAVGGFSSRNASVYALAMGYNVIAGTGGRSSYRNVIDRKALVYRKSNL